MKPPREEGGGDRAASSAARGGGWSGEDAATETGALRVMSSLAEEVGGHGRPHRTGVGATKGTTDTHTTNAARPRRDRGARRIGGGAAAAAAAADAPYVTAALSL